ncbi:GDSL-type esterase/lipase family protein [Rhizobium sp.]
MNRLLLSVLCMMLGAASAGAAECNRFATTITTTPVLYQWTSALEKASLLLDAPPKQADTILLGDSLLAFWPKDLAESQFGKNKVWNFAVGGSRTQHILWQLDRLGRSTLRPREIVVLIGTNNLSDEKLPACAIAEGIKAVVTRTRATWSDARIHVMGIPPRGSDFHFRDADRKAINGEIREWLAGQPKTHYFSADDMVMTCGQYAGVAVASADEALPSGSRCQNYADDFGHFRRPGYDVIYSALRAN